MGEPGSPSPLAEIHDLGNGLQLKASWAPAGPIDLVDRMLVFPPVDERPAVYRFDFGDRWYVGETDRLRRRWQHYRTPGPSQRTNLRLRALMVEALTGGGAIDAHTVYEPALRLEQQSAPLDLSARWARILVEETCIAAAHGAGIHLENR